MAGNGTTLVVNFAITFNTATFSGVKNTFTDVQDFEGHASGWVGTGTWNVADTLTTFRTCVAAGSPATTCTLPTATYPISQPIVIGHSNVVVTGGTANRSQTVLFRDPAYTGPMMQVDASQPLTGITIQNLTFCGSSTLPNPSPSSACPARVQTTCGNWTDQATQGLVPSGPICADLQINNADTGMNPTNPFTYTGPYSVTIANIDFEDAAGHTISIFPAAPKKVDDVYIHDSAINSSAVTGILSGVAGVSYDDSRVCDGNANFSNDINVYLPRNIRIEGNTFQNNNTGAIGMNARWVGLRNNNTPGFVNNYINPQAGNHAGGTVFFDQCTDQVQIRNNALTGPTLLTTTSGLELWGRNIDIRGNTVTNYPGEGIGANSLFNATISNNQTPNNGRGGATGGIIVWTSGPGGPCDQIPRDTQTVSISANTSTGQAYGILLGDRDTASRNTINNLTITGDNTLQPPNELAHLDPFVTLNGPSIVPTTTTPPPSSPGQTFPRALPVQTIAPLSSKCSLLAATGKPSRSQPVMYTVPATSSGSRESLA